MLRTCLRYFPRHSSNSNSKAINIFTKIVEAKKSEKLDQVFSELKNTFGDITKIKGIIPREKYIAMMEFLNQKFESDHLLKIEIDEIVKAIENSKHISDFRRSVILTSPLRNRNISIDSTQQNSESDIEELIDEQEVIDMMKKTDDILNNVKKEKKEEKEEYKVDKTNNSKEPEDSSLISSSKKKKAKMEKEVIKQQEKSNSESIKKAKDKSTKDGSDVQKPVKEKPVKEKNSKKPKEVKQESTFIEIGNQKSKVK